MVDLDSNPTKLIEVVEIGKQLLITRGSLTTFSIANDVAKYFAIIPAMFVGVFPQLDTLNVMQLESPRSAILSAGEPTGETMLASVDDISVAASGASNLGPTNEDLLATVEERIAEYRDVNGLADDALVPVDAVTASGSGVDPQISVANARLQAPRVAEERGLEVAEVERLIDDHTSSRPLGVLGEKGVNVLQLNLALDDLAG
jgi:hypothetical protein